jgi:hypothetical protein
MKLKMSQKTTNLVEAKEAGKGLSYPALEASIGRLNVLPLNQKRKIIKAINDLKYLDTNIINYKDIDKMLSIETFKFSSDKHNDVLKLISTSNLYGYLVHQSFPLNPLFDIPEIKDIYEALIETIQLNKDIISKTIEELLETSQRFIQESEKVKQNIINNYKKIFVLNKIFYVTKEVFDKYGEVFLTLFFKRNYSQRSETFDGLASILKTTNFDSLINNYLITNFTESDKLKESKGYLSLGDPVFVDMSTGKRMPIATSTKEISFEELEKVMFSNLKIFSILPVYIVTKDFYKNKAIESIEKYIFYHLFIQKFLIISDSKVRHTSKTEKAMLNICYTLDEKELVDVLDNKIKNVKSILAYNPSNPFPKMVVENDKPFTELEESKSILKIKGSTGDVLAKIYNYRQNSGSSLLGYNINSIFLSSVLPYTEGYSNVFRTASIAKGSIATKDTIYRSYNDIIDVNILTLDFGELSDINKLVKTFLEVLGPKSIGQGYIQGQIVAFNVLVKTNSLLLKISTAQLLIGLENILRALHGTGVINLVTFNLNMNYVSNIQKFITDKINGELNLKEIYVMYHRVNPIPGNSDCYPLHRPNTKLIGMAPIILSRYNRLKTPLFEIKLKDPQKSIELFGNKTAKNKIFKEYQESSKPHEYLNSLLPDFRGSAHSDFNESYISNSLKGKGVLNPIKIISLSYLGVKYKFVLDDFEVECKTLQYVYLDVTSAKNVTSKKKLLISVGKTKVQSKINISSRCNTSDILLIIPYEKNDVLMYNSGKSKIDSFVRVRNESNNLEFNLNSKHIKLYEKKAVVKKKSKN